MRRDQSVGCRRSRNHLSARQSGGVYRSRTDSGGGAVLGGAGGSCAFEEGTALRAQLNTGQRLQRAHGARLFYGVQEVQVQQLPGNRGEHVSHRPFILLRHVQVHIPNLDGVLPEANATWTGDVC